MRTLDTGILDIVSVPQNTQYTVPQNTLPKYTVPGIPQIHSNPIYRNAQYRAPEYLNTKLDKDNTNVNLLMAHPV